MQLNKSSPKQRTNVPQQTQNEVIEFQTTFKNFNSSGPIHQGNTNHEVASHIYGGPLVVSLVKRCNIPKVIVSDVSHLRIKRGSLKAQLTLFEKYLSKIETQQIVLNLRNLKTRLEKITPLFEEFNCIQYEIKCLIEQDEEENMEMNERDIDNQSQSSSSHTKQPIGNINQPAVQKPTIKLPTFDGTFTLWREFSNGFLSIIDSDKTIPDNRKLNYLKSSLKGEPADLLRPLEITDANYSIAWEKLNKKYENKRKIIYVHLLLEIPLLGKDYLSGLTKMVNTIETYLECLKTWEVETKN
ncbi:hypothetical protein ILUMI_14665 [Ignelater luminosus]|uniref:Uncharacterized protein n=1 Tax=Ignelater luminosus TaxID=2038154 RepID=A0A8K0G9U0_IGNLU|nr:hypothetical protein ILUMI_14665 [Ignelater luminosus]